MSNFTVTSISAAPFIPLSASYGYDDKISLNPTLLQYSNGYSFFQHPLFTGTKDSKFANDSFFSITSATLLQTLINDTTYIDPTELGIFTSFKAPNEKYITNINNTLYATATAIGQNEFFRVIKNSDGTCLISQNDLYATVVITKNVFTIEMQDKISNDTNKVQRFILNIQSGTDKFTIKTLFTIDAWAPTYTAPIQRYWSYDDNEDNIVKANGMIKDDDYVDENSYVFSTNIDLNIFPIGFDGKIIWVRYYNNSLDNFFNKSVDIKDIIENIQQNYLVEYPYKTKIDITNYQDSFKTGRIKLNILNLKSILTPEYENAVKKE